MTKQTTWFTVIGLGLAVVAGSTVAIAAKNDTTGTVTVESKSVALGIGVSWGDGVLTFRGKTHKFSVDGLSVVDLGIAKVSARGTVKNLKNLEDFSGNYVAAGAGAAVGGGASVVALKNQNGVEMKLTATTQGVKLALATAGIDVKLKQ